MVEWQIIVGVLKLNGIAGRPEFQRCEHSEGGDEGQSDQCGNDTIDRQQPSRQRIGHKPAGVGQRELRGKKRRAVLGMGRAAQQPPRRNGEKR